jgi:hypothetical protein
MKIKDSNVIDDFIENFAKTIADESLKLISDVERGDDLGIKIASRFIHHLVKNLVQSSVSTIKVSSETYKEAKAKFLHVKGNIQSNVASGYESALRDLTGQSVEYFCKIEAVPEITSTAIN